MSRDNTIESTLFLGANNKFKELVNCLLKCPEEENYYLILVSCYFRCRSAQELIEAIRDKINPLKLWVEIYIDPIDVLNLKTGKQELCNWKSSLQSEHLEISVRIFDRKAQSNLFHPKAYCLSSCKEDRRNCHGSLVVGSPNLTGRGLTKDNSNVELLLNTQSNEDIKKFYKNLNELDFIEIEDLNDCEFTDFFYDSYIDEDEFPQLEDEFYRFCFSLLSLGYLVHSWDVRLSDYFKVRYDLKKRTNEEDSKENDNLEQIIKHLKFKKVEQKSLTKDYSPKYVRDFNKRPNEFIRLRGDYGVETLLGYWIPKQKVDQFRNEDKFKKLKDDVIPQLEKELDQLQEQVKSDWRKLQEYITTKEETVVKKIKSIQNLIKHESSQRRISDRYGICELPYRIRQKQEVESLYKSLIETCENSSSNKTKDAVLELHKNPQKDLSLIRRL